MPAIFAGRSPISERSTACSGPSADSWRGAGDRIPARAARQKLKLVARPAVRLPRVVFSHGPAILANKTLTVVDLSLGAAQTSFALTLDAQGGVTTSWLVDGHYYTVWVRGQRSVNMLWPMKGQVNVATLEQKASEAVLAAAWTNRWQKKKR